MLLTRSLLSTNTFRLALCAPCTLRARNELQNHRYWEKITLNTCFRRVPPKTFIKNIKKRPFLQFFTIPPTPETSWYTVKHHKRHHRPSRSVLQSDATSVLTVNPQKTPYFGGSPLKNPFYCEFFPKGENFAYVSCTVILIKITV
jgi:hypothetical protein